MSRQNVIWESPDAGLSPSQQLLLPDFLEWMEKSDLPIAQALALLSEVSPKKSFIAKQMKALQDSIQSQSESMRVAHQRLQLLGKLVAHFNKIGMGPIPQPSISRLTLKPHNPFADGVTTERQCVGAWIKVEQEWIDACAKAPPLELVVLSAMLHGGLLHATSLVCLTRALLAAPTTEIGCTAKRVYIDLTLPWHGQADMEMRRWYPDDQTASLVRRPEQYAGRENWHGSEGFSNTQISKKLFQLINQRMRSHGVSKDLRSKNMQQLTAVVATAARTEIPAVLIEYASRQIVSHSLKPLVLARLFDRPEVFEEKDETTEFGERLDLEEDDVEEKEEVQMEWLSKLREAFRSTDRAEIQRRLNFELDSFANTRSAGHRITQFAHYLLTQRHLEHGRSVSHRPWAIDTIKALAISSIGRRLGGMLCGKDPISIGIDMETLYTQVLGNVIEGQDIKRLKGTVRNALREFHEFLVNQCGASPLDDPTLLGNGRGLLPVDARLITLEEYFAALHCIDDMYRDYDGKVRHAARAMLILGFRCGLRRMEAHGLEVDDLTDQSSPWLLVRPNEARQLKTDNAKRQLPLACLIPKEQPIDELDVLYSWKRERNLNRGKDCVHFFAIAENTEHGNSAYTVIPVELLIHIIHRALREVTRDNSLRFHVLRHSFATWTYLRLAISDLNEIPDLFPHLAQTSAWLNDAKAFRSGLYGTANLTRKHAMAVASLLGHSGPAVSLEHYVHCMDLLLPAFLSESKLLGVSSTRRVIIASAKPHSALYKRVAAIPVEQFLTRFPEYVLPTQAQANDPSSTGKFIATSVPSADKTWDLLFLRGTTNESLDSLAERFGFSLESAQTNILSALAIQHVKEPVGRMSLRHLMSLRSFDEATTDCGNSSAWPRYPRSIDKQVFSKVEPLIRSLALSDQMELRRVLAYFVNNSWRSLNTLFFRDPRAPGEAIRYVKFLNSLDYPTDRMRFISFDRRQRYTSKAVWMEALGLSWRQKRQIEICDPPYKKSSASSDWLGIVPDFEVLNAHTNKAISHASPSPQRHASNKRKGLTPGGDRPGSSGFRFMMTMAAISFGFDQEVLY